MPLVGALGPAPEQGECECFCPLNGDNDQELEDWDREKDMVMQDARDVGPQPRAPVCQPLPAWYVSGGESDAVLLAYL